MFQQFFFPGRKIPPIPIIVVDAIPGNIPGQNSKKEDPLTVAVERGSLDKLGPFDPSLLGATFKTVSTVLVLVAQWRRVLNWHTLQRTNISHLRKRKIIFKMPFLGDMLVPWRVVQRSKACFKNIWNIENQLHRRTLLNAEDQRGLLWVFKHVTRQNLGGGLKWSKMY